MLRSTMLRVDELEELMRATLERVNELEELVGTHESIVAALPAQPPGLAKEVEEKKDEDSEEKK